MAVAYTKTGQIRGKTGANPARNEKTQRPWKGTTAILRAKNTAITAKNPQNSPYADACAAIPRQSLAHFLLFTSGVQLEANTTL